MNYEHVTFEPINPPTKANYSCSADQMCVERVMIRDDWCLTIVRDSSGTYNVYGHWSELKLNWGECADHSSARTIATQSASVLINMLSRKKGLLDSVPVVTHVEPSRTPADILSAMGNPVGLCLTGSWSKAKANAKSDFDFFASQDSWDANILGRLDASDLAYHYRKEAYVEALVAKHDDVGMRHIVYVPSLDTEIQIQVDQHAMRARVEAEIRELRYEFYRARCPVKRKAVLDTNIRTLTVFLEREIL